MDVESFLIEIAGSEAYQKIAYKRLSIGMFIGLYYMMKPEKGCIDPFMIPFRDFIKEQIYEKQIDIDALLKYMIENDQSNSSFFLAATLFKRKSELSEYEFFNAIAKDKIITPFVESVDQDVLALIVVSFVNIHAVERFFPAPACRSVPGWVSETVTALRLTPARPSETPKAPRSVKVYLLIQKNEAPASVRFRRNKHPFLRDLWE